MPACVHLPQIVLHLQFFVCARGVIHRASEQIFNLGLLIISWMLTCLIVIIFDSSIIIKLSCMTANLQTNYSLNMLQYLTNTVEPSSGLKLFLNKLKNVCLCVKPETNMKLEVGLRYFFGGLFFIF